MIVRCRRGEGKALTLSGQNMERGTNLGRGGRAWWKIVRERESMSDREEVRVQVMLEENGGG